MAVAIHQQVLGAANQIAQTRPDFTFRPYEVVNALPHLNYSSVRTHIVSRCCVNARKNHPHKWPYFRRIGRGTYQIEAAHRQRYAPKSPGSKPAVDTRRGSGLGGGSAVRTYPKSMIHVMVQKEDDVYVAECAELAIVTQASTLDEVVTNFREALSLHVEGEDLAALGLGENPRIQLLYDVPMPS